MSDVKMKGRHQLPGPAGSANGHQEAEPTRFEVVRAGARTDGVEIVHYEPQFAAGAKAEKRLVRVVAFLLLLSGLAAVAAVAAFIWWPFTDFPAVTGWEYEPGNSWMKGFTPFVGACLGIALGAFGIAILAWGKKLLPHEIAIQERHDGSDPDEAALTGSTLQFIGEELGLNRRPLLKAALLAPAAGLGAAAVVVPVGMLLKDPHRPDVLFHTGWDPAANGGKLVHLVREDETKIRPEDISTGGQITAFPGIPGGTTNKHADSPVLLIKLREDDAATLRANLTNYPKNAEDGGGMYGNLVAYSKICTHAGCPASLYEQKTNRLLCPCHQSQFDITDNARPVFGPATQRLPMLALDVDDEGFLVAKSDFGGVPVGPAFWEKPEV